VLVEVEGSEVVSGEMAVAGAKPFVVVGIPAFNEEAMIARVVLEARKLANAVVVCDDGSDDLTGEIAKRMGADVVQHSQNLGYGAALKSIVKRARELDADVLVTLDGDGQHRPAEIPGVIQPILGERADVVIGSRFVDSEGVVEMPLHRRFGAKVITKLVNWSAKTSVKDAQSGFRAYSRRALEGLSVFESGMGASVEIIREAKERDLKICEVSCSCNYKKGRDVVSKRNPVAHGVGVLMSIIRLVIDEKPLQILGVPGLLCLIAGMAFGAWTMDIYRVSHVIPTGPAIAAMTLLLTSFFLLSTAIMLYAISRLARRMNGK
jgi:glycosyltransferase involved in cell wall biosynthesis